MKGLRLQLGREYVIGDRIGGGGFGQVFAASSSDDEAVAAKFVPKAPGADRELLFVELAGARNVVPVIDTGEHDDHWVLVMPRADSSLRDRLDEAAGEPLEMELVLAVARDVCDALVDLDGKVVHRDLKPENLLLLSGHWCLADFGISRYAEATTAPDTRKFALSPPYAAPERWRSERATIATDVYALGAIVFEMIAGTPPFAGSTLEEFRELHLHGQPARLDQVPAGLGAMIDECLYKAPEARPRPANLRARLDQLLQAGASPGLARLAEANRAQVARRSDAARRESEARTESERRQALFDSAQRSFEALSQSLLNPIHGAAPAASLSDRHGDRRLALGHAALTLSLPRSWPAGPWQGGPPPFDVIAVASLDLRIPADQFGYEGRSHSLWFGNVQSEDHYAWYETAFMISVLMQRQGKQDPFALDPGEEAARALGSGMADFQLAWPFTPLVPFSAPREGKGC
jgi:serine/threonine-protein kinase